jgi:hypothetical protein
LGPNVITSVFIKAEEDLMTTKKAIWWLKQDASPWLWSWKKHHKPRNTKNAVPENNKAGQRTPPLPHTPLAVTQSCRGKGPC